MDFVNARRTGALAQPAAQSRLLLIAAHSQDFHRAIEIISDPSGQSKLTGFVVDKPAVADALDPAAHNIAFGNHLSYALER